MIACLSAVILLAKPFATAGEVSDEFDGGSVGLERDPLAPGTSDARGGKRG
jgi:hypothetical protein